MEKPESITLEQALALIAELRAEIARLKEENAALKARLSPDPATPSGALPVYEKPSKKGRKKRPGRPFGHTGSWRKVPQDIARTVEHELACCPHCGSAHIKRQARAWRRIVEDAPPVAPEAVAHVTPLYECADCGRIVHAPLLTALPRMRIGLSLLIQTAWLHYGLGMTAGSVVKYLNTRGKMRVSAGGLLQMWGRLAAHLRPFYEELHQAARQAEVLHADETGWRVLGRTWWLWCFTAETVVFYVLRPCRGAQVVGEVLGEVFEGVLCCDFFGAYHAIEAWAKQRCVVHLARELKKVSQRNGGAEWKAFRRRLKGLLTAAYRLKQYEERMAADAYWRRVEGLQARLQALLDEGGTDRDVARLKKRLLRHREEILTFLISAAPADNNAAEREIRPAVVMRKNSYGNMSERGAETQALLMSVFRTLHKRGEDPLAWVKRYVEERLAAGERPEAAKRAA